MQKQDLDGLKDLCAQPETYGFGCGGFPIIVKGQGIVGAIAVSGLPDPADHFYVIQALEQFLGVKAPEIPAEIDRDWIN